MCRIDEALAYPANQVGEESQRLARHPDRLSAGLVLLSSFEEDFYRTNGLPHQLSQCFARHRKAVFDERAFFMACAEAQQLLHHCYFLDDTLSALYLALRRLGLRGPVHLRRPGQTFAVSCQLGSPGWELPVAIKQLWDLDWTPESVEARMEESGGEIALEARPVLVLAGEPGALDPQLSSELERRALVSGGKLCGLL